MTKPRLLYEVWSSGEGRGLAPGPRFRLKADAVRYVREHAREATFMIRCPDGGWERLVPRPTPRDRW